MKTRTIALSTVLAALLALTGCAQGTVPAASAADAHPMLGFASPGASPTDAPLPPRFEDARILPKPVAMTNKWAR